MQLLLWRHAEAEDGFPDSARRLTPKGEKQADQMAAFLRKRLPSDTRILVSPAKRTQQTAQALSSHFITEATIAPGASAQAVLKAADWPTNDACVLIVGHQPTLGNVAAMLMSGQPGYWSVKKGAIWWFNHRQRDEYAETTLRLAITPELL